MRGLVAIAAVSVLLSGCASSNAQLAPGHSQPTADALNLWKDFPADSSARPLVLTGPTIDDPSTGFPPGDDKLAYMSGQFTMATALPGGSSTWHQQQLITADQALAELRSSGQGAPLTSAALSVTAVQLGTATFSTDRGQRSLPAWVFRFAGVSDPASVLAIGAANRWPKVPRPSQENGNLAAKIAPDGDTVTITFIGASAGTGPCEAQYAADTAQSDTAVVVFGKGTASGHQPTNQLGRYCAGLRRRRLSALGDAQAQSSPGRPGARRFLRGAATCRLIPSSSNPTASQDHEWATARCARARA